MIALVRYHFATVLHTQRYLAPLLLFTGLMGVLTVNGNGPLPPTYASSAGALFVCATWLTIALMSLDDAAQRAVVVVSAGRSLRVLAGAVVTSLLSCVVLMGFGLFFPLWLGDYRVAPADLLLGVEAQLTCAFVGVGIGVLCSRLVFRRQGYALVAALALVMVLLFTRGLPPVNRLFQVMATASDSAALLGPAGAMLGLAAGVLVVCTAVTQYVASRRE
ncbi:hypothetical protein [Streptomyces sp. MST-110588]|uniref:hypothetical protein n=1 Tax=Streptomyces sp. MST-110588 TaxID=2833628 RepID=UPI001F5E09A0|nr:hypothetical protein [Streptomyces sp. MST-110588]UNO40663.1 hypothetical protein KGS77_15135 [Streptomyces sp. MST-110588]